MKLPKFFHRGFEVEGVRIFERGKIPPNTPAQALQNNIFMGEISSIPLKDPNSANFCVVVAMGDQTKGAIAHLQIDIGHERVQQIAQTMRMLLPNATGVNIAGGCGEKDFCDSVVLAFKQIGFRTAPESNDVGPWVGAPIWRRVSVHSEGISVRRDPYIGPIEVIELPRP